MVSCSKSKRQKGGRYRRQKVARLASLTDSGASFAIPLELFNGSGQSFSRGAIIKMDQGYPVNLSGFYLSLIPG